MTYTVKFVNFTLDELRLKKSRPLLALYGSYTPMVLRFRICQRKTATAAAAAAGLMCILHSASSYRRR